MAAQDAWKLLVVTAYFLSLKHSLWVWFLNWTRGLRLLLCLTITSTEGRGKWEQCEPGRVRVSSEVWRAPIRGRSNLIFAPSAECVCDLSADPDKDIVIICISVCPFSMP